MGLDAVSGMVNVKQSKLFLCLSTRSHGDMLNGFCLKRILRYF